MKIFTVLFFALWLTISMIHAQITVTDATFPAAGDTLKTAIDLSPDSIEITPPGGPMTWNFNALTATSKLVTVFQPAANGSAVASYPDADLVVISDLGTESYFDVTPSSFNLLGLSGTGLAVGLPIETDLKYSPPLIERRAPLDFFDVYLSTSNALLPIALSEIPSEILDSLGVPTGLLDSIRIRIHINRTEIVDGFGTLTIPGGTYEVLRQNRIDYNEVRFDAHSPFLGWLDITSQLPLEGFGFDTVSTYHFMSATEKEPIAIVTMDPTFSFAQQVEFKDNGVSSAVQHVTSQALAVRISPNPASDEITIELTDRNVYPLTLSMFDGNGQQVMVRTLTQDREILSVASLVAGTYFYQVMDGTNHVRSTGKLMKVD